MGGRRAQRPCRSGWTGPAGHSGPRGRRAVRSPYGGSLVGEETACVFIALDARRLLARMGEHLVFGGARTEVHREGGLSFPAPKWYPTVPDRFPYSVTPIKCMH